MRPLLRQFLALPGVPQFYAALTRPRRQDRVETPRYAESHDEAAEIGVVDAAHQLWRSCRERMEQAASLSVPSLDLME